MSWACGGTGTSDQFNAATLAGAITMVARNGLLGFAVWRRGWARPRSRRRNEQDHVHIGDGSARVNQTKPRSDQNNHKGTSDAGCIYSDGLLIPPPRSRSRPPPPPNSEAQ